MERKIKNLLLNHVAEVIIRDGIECIKIHDGQKLTNTEKTLIMENKLAIIKAIKEKEMQERMQEEKEYQELQEAIIKDQERTARIHVKMDKKPKSKIVEEKPTHRNIYAYGECIGTERIK